MHDLPVALAISLNTNQRAALESYFRRRFIADHATGEFQPSTGDVYGLAALAIGLDRFAISFQNNRRKYIVTLKFFLQCIFQGFFADFLLWQIEVSLSAPVPLAHVVIEDALTQRAVSGILMNNRKRGMNTKASRVGFFLVGVMNGLTNHFSKVVCPDREFLRLARDDDWLLFGL